MQDFNLYQTVLMLLYLYFYLSKELSKWHIYWVLFWAADEYIFGVLVRL